MKLFITQFFNRNCSRILLSTKGARPFWKHVEMGPKDPILGVTEAFQADESPTKLNLGVGAYRDDDGKPWVLPSVKKAEELFRSSPTDNHEYGPITGPPKFRELSKNLAFESTSESDLSRICTVQSLSGTGSLRLFAQFVAKFWPKSELPKVYVPTPTWENHFPIFQHAGIQTVQYRYYDPSTLGLDLRGMVEDISKADDNSVILLHASAHNPTGVDPKPDGWVQIYKACRGKFILFDMAYQGLASGDCSKDAQPLQLFFQEGQPLALAQSYAKNMGLYGHRVGAFSLVMKNSDERKKVESQVKIVARAIYSNPPIYGGKIVETILGNENLKKEWLGDVKTMANRIISMRSSLKNYLEKSGSSRDWSHVTDQIGMFCFSGMSPEQVDTLASDHHIYMTRNGRISMAGVTSKNVEQLANAIHQVTK